MTSFQDKCVLVTGAGGGIGLAVVKTFLSRGATVVATDLNDNTLEETGKCSTRPGQKIHLITGNLADPEFCDHLPRQAHSLTGQLDIIVNNAGIMRRGDILNTSDEDWALTMQINLEAIFRICRASIPILKDAGGGAIVNTASCWGIYPGPNHVAYCTSKAAVAALTQCLGRDHARDGIRVNAVCPNEVNTPMLRTGFEIRGIDPDSAINTLNDSVPIGRIAEPEDIADAIAFLACDDARYICGTLLEVNGAKPVY